jgi:hypothetical protein
MKQDMSDTASQGLLAAEKDKKQMQENGSKKFECTAENRNFCLLTDGIDQCLHTILGGGDQGHVAQLFMHGFFLRRNGMNWDYVYAQSDIWYNAEIFGYFGLARKS